MAKVGVRHLGRDGVSFFDLCRDEEVRLAREWRERDGDRLALGHRRVEVAPLAFGRIELLGLAVLEVHLIRER